MSNRSPNQTIKLTTSLKESLQLHFKYMIKLVNLSQIFSGYYTYVQGHRCYCKLFDTNRCSVVTNCNHQSSKAVGYKVIVVIDTSKTLVDRWSGKLPLWLSYAVSKIYTIRSQSQFLQLVCNQGNHSVVKTTNLFLH